MRRDSPLRDHNLVLIDSAQRCQTPVKGLVAEWLRRGLQILASRFDSGRGLQTGLIWHWRRRDLMIRLIGPISLGLGDPMSNAAQLRRNMVDTQLRTYDVTSLPLLDAVESVDREPFMPAALRNLAYIDQVVTLGGEGGGRRLLTPMVLARLLQAADIHKGDRVLDIAGGTGYGAAIMRALGADVTMLEATEGLASQARSALSAAGIAGVDVMAGALVKGASKKALFDVIIVNGAIETSPNALLDQLADGGRLVAVVGAGRSGRVTVFSKNGQTVGQKAAFDAAADLLPEFAQRQGFVF